MKSNVRSEKQLKRLKLLDDEIDSDIGQITIRTPEPIKSDSNDLILLREYAIGLDKILMPDLKSTEEKIKKFSEECFLHLRGSDENIFNTDK